MAKKRKEKDEPQPQGNGVRRRVEVKPGEVGSRQVTSGHIRDLIGALRQDHVDKFSRFTVWRFGHDDTLEYPVDSVHEAIDEYDVRRIHGTGYAGGDPTPILEVDLWAGGGMREWGWLFLVNGPKEKVDRVLAVLRDQWDKWPRTWHSRFHSVAWTLAGTFGLASLGGAIFIVVVMEYFTASRVVLLLAYLYIVAFAAIVAFGNGLLAPFIWFNRKGSIVEARRVWLPGLSIGAGAAILIGIVANLIWSVVSG